MKLDLRFNGQNDIHVHVYVFVSNMFEGQPTNDLQS